jgi:hypothetical protein
VGAFFLLSFFPPQKKFSLLFFSLSLFTSEKASEESEEKKGTLKINPTTT